jgi:hypothetical protein
MLTEVVLQRVMRPHWLAYGEDLPAMGNWAAALPQSDSPYGEDLPAMGNWAAALPQPDFP